MADTIRSRIWADVLTKLGAITGGGTPPAPPTAVEEPVPGEGIRSGNLRYQLITDDDPAEAEGPMQFKTWEHSFRVQFEHYRTEGDSSLVLRKAAESCAADIEKALTEDTSYSRGGLAIDTIATGSIVSIDGEDAHKAEVVCNFVVTYRHAWSDPTSQTP